LIKSLRRTHLLSLIQHHHDKPIHTNLNCYLPSWEEEIHTPSPLEATASPVENLLHAIPAQIKKNAASTGHQASPSPLSAPSPGLVTISTTTRRDMTGTRLRGEITTEVGTVVGGGEDIDRAVDILMMIMMITIDVIGVIVGREKRNYDNEIDGHESREIYGGFCL
jgi:hypothetical protein